MSTFITVYNRSVRVETKDQTLVDLIVEFLKNFYTVVPMVMSKPQGHNYYTKKIEEEPVQDTVYVSKINDLNIWYLHTNQFGHLIGYLTTAGYDIKKYLSQAKDERDYSPVKMNYKMRSHWKLRPVQEDIVSFLTEEPTNTKLVPILPGGGKTVIGLWTSAIHNERLAVLILAQFIPKWIDDIKGGHEADGKDILVIQGGDSIVGLVAMAKEGTLSQKYIIFSADTLRSFITQFEEDPYGTHEKYGITPIELFPLIGVGTLLVDETHMSFHAVYKILLHANVKRLIGLSATLITTDMVINRVHHVLYPTKVRYNKVVVNKYYTVYPVTYNIDSSLFGSIKVSHRGSTFYSHTAFEQSIMKNKKLLYRYLFLIKRNLEDYYIEDYFETDKAVIFVATIKMATYVTDYMKEHFPDKSVKRFVEEDSYEDMLKGDIIVSTVGSLGTGIDITDENGKNCLRTVIQTVSISSPTSNIQTCGRLRDLVTRDTKFVYLWCPQIRQHRNHHRARLGIFQERAKNIVERRSSVDI